MDQDNYDKLLNKWAKSHYWDSLEKDKDLILRHLRTFAGDGMCEADQDKILMPKELTVENGAKYLMIGEFYEEEEIHCYECDTHDDQNTDCEACDGNGYYIQKTQVSWTTIKEIYKKAVEFFTKEPK